MNETIEDGWKQLFKEVFEGEVSENESDQLKLAFYSGAYDLFQRFNAAAMSKNPLRVVALIQETQAEYEEFRQPYVRGGSK